MSNPANLHGHQEPRAWLEGGARSSGGFLAPHGKVLIELTFDEVGDLADGRAEAGPGSVGNYTGYTDGHSNVVITQHRIAYEMDTGTPRRSAARLMRALSSGFKRKTKRA